MNFPIPITRCNADDKSTPADLTRRRMDEPRLTGAVAESPSLAAERV